MLEGKGYTVVFDDFLNYTPNLNFDYIIMNPPFSDCLDHILKAWDILDDGMVISVMPVTALEGKTAKEQLLLHRIEQSGTQPELVGQAFKYSERPTDVEVAVVRLVKRGTNFKMGFEVKNDQERPDEETEEELNAKATGQEVAVTGYVNDLLAHFQAAVANYAAYNEARVKIERYIAPIHKFYDGDHTIEVMETADEKKKPSERYNTFVDLLQQAAWVKVLDHPGFQSLLTDRARKAMTEFRQRQRRVDFNEFNIRAMFAEIYAQKDALLDAAIQDAFDNMTKYHKYNREHVEGWKSNEAYRATRRLVLPNYVKYDYFGFGINWNYRDELNDIDRAMCVVSRMRYDSIKTMEQALQEAWGINKKRPGKCVSTFFEVRYYMKGTIHLYFRDERIWQQFNILAAKGRNWLPSGD